MDSNRQIQMGRALLLRVTILVRFGGFYFLLPAGSTTRVLGFLFGEPPVR